MIINSFFHPGLWASSSPCRRFILGLLGLWVVCRWLTVGVVTSLVCDITKGWFLTRIVCFSTLEQVKGGWDGLFSSLMETFTGRMKLQHRDFRGFSFLFFHPDSNPHISNWFFFFFVFTVAVLLNTVHLRRCKFDHFLSWGFKPFFPQRVSGQPYYRLRLPSASQFQFALKLALTRCSLGIRASSDWRAASTPAPKPSHNPSARPWIPPKLPPKCLKNQFSVRQHPDSLARWMSYCGHPAGGSTALPQVLIPTDLWPLLMPHLPPLLTFLASPFQECLLHRTTCVRPAVYFFLRERERILSSLLAF